MVRRWVTTVLPAAPAAAIDAISAFGRFAAGRGWVPARAGNFSVRVDADHALVTRSGVDKGSIDASGVAVLALDAPIPAGMSAEAPLHLARYRTDAGVGAIFHVHTVAATVLSRRDLAAGFVRTEGFEMHKTLNGIPTHDGTIEIPVFRNDQDTAGLAREIEAQLGAAPPIPGFLLAGHGLYAWGATAEDARRHVEGLEFLLACHLEERRLR